MRRLTRVSWDGVQRRKSSLDAKPEAPQPAARATRRRSTEAATAAPATLVTDTTIDDKEPCVTVTVTVPGLQAAPTPRRLLTLTQVCLSPLSLFSLHLTLPG
jgi:hypothetical protein